MNMCAHVALLGLGFSYTTIIVGFVCAAPKLCFVTSFSSFLCILICLANACSVLIYNVLYNFIFCLFLVVFDAWGLYLGPG